MAPSGQRVAEGPRASSGWRRSGSTLVAARHTHDRAHVVANADNKEWSLYGAQRSQRVATGGKWDGRKNGSNRRKPLPWLATSCLGCSMGRNAMKKGLPGDTLWLVTGSYRRGGPLRCYTPVWISVASVSTSTCSTLRGRRSTLARRHRTRTVYLD